MSKKIEDALDVVIMAISESGFSPTDIGDSHVWDALNDLEAYFKKYRWISVDEALPELGKRGFSDAALVCFKGYYGETIEVAAYITEANGEKVWFGESGHRIYTVTHWRPLPDLPDGEEGD